MKSERHTNINESAEEIAAIISRYRASGLGLEAFAGENGIPLGRLQYWIYQKYARRANQRLPATSPLAISPVFQEIKLPSMPPSGNWATEVSLGGGMAVRFSASASAQWIGSVIEALQRPC
jgi:hypothetical protein